MSEQTDRAARADAAAAVRRLGHAMVSKVSDTNLLERIAREVDELARLAEEGGVRSRTPNTSRPFFEPPTASSPPEHKNLFAESIISGELNPLSAGADLWSEEDEAVLEVSLGPAFEGAPGRAHGGVVAALVDETMGIVLAIHDDAAYTGRLTVTYRAGTPVGETVTCRARLTGREGRKLFMTAEVTSGGLLCAEAEAVFITVDKQRFAAQTDAGIPGATSTLN